MLERCMRWLWELPLPDLLAAVIVALFLPT